MYSKYWKKKTSNQEYYLAKLFIQKGKRESFLGKQKIKEFITTKLAW